MENIMRVLDKFQYPQVARRREGRQPGKVFNRCTEAEDTYTAAIMKDFEAAPLGLKAVN
jgi:hypothetical protein